MSDFGHGYPAAPAVPVKDPAAGEERPPAPPSADGPAVPQDPDAPTSAKAPPVKPVKEKVENAVMSYVLPLAAGAALMTTCWGIGRFGYSFAWVGLFVGLNYLKSKLWRHREKRVLALQTAAKYERQTIMAQLQDLPAWVQFPDTERVEWINKVIMQLWPYIGEYTKTFIAEVVEPQVKANLPSPFKSFRFDQIDMGDIPLRVGGIKVYTENVGRDRIIMDMDVAYAGDCDFVVAVGGFRGGLNQMQFKGKLRVVLKPLIAMPPMVGGVTAFFLDDPSIDFNLTGIGEMVEIPGLMGAIRNVVTTQVRSICVLPNEIVVPLTAETDVAALHVPAPDGVVRIGILEARDLENMDISFIKKGKSDPYAVASVGAQHFTTKVIDNDLNPKWNEWFEAVVDQASGQKLQVEIFDEDNGKDEELGRLTLDLEQIRRKGVSDAWYQLEGAKQGELRLKTYWMSLSTSPSDLDRNAWLPEFKASKNPLNPALLLAYVDCASDLPFPKRNLEPSPYVVIRVGKEERKTFPKPRTVNPLYQHKELIFVPDPENQAIHLEAFDEGTKKSLGEVSVPMSRLVGEPRMELYQQTFPLSLGAHTSTLVATFRLRGLKPSSGGLPAPSAAAGTKAAVPTLRPQAPGTSPSHGPPKPQRLPDHVSITAYREAPDAAQASHKLVEATAKERRSRKDSAKSAEKAAAKEAAGRERSRESGRKRRDSSAASQRVESWVESVVSVHGVIETEPVKLAVKKEQEQLSVRAVKRGDKEKRPVRRHSSSRPPSKAPTDRHEKEHKHKSSEKLHHKSRESVGKSSGRLSRKESHKSEPQLDRDADAQSLEKRSGNGSVASTPAKSAAKGALARSASSASRTSRSSSLRSLVSGRKKLRRKASLSSGKAGEVGRLQIRLRYSFQTNDLVVTVLQAEKLRPASTDGAADPYVKVRLLLDNSEKEEFKTRIVMASLGPEFNQTFSFPLDHKDLGAYSLFFKVKDGASYGLFTKPPVLGKCLYPLGEFDPHAQVEEWFDLSF